LSVEELPLEVCSESDALLAEEPALLEAAEAVELAASVGAAAIAETASAQQTRTYFM